MKRYKGIFLDGTVFQTKEDVDRFLREEAVRSYRTSVEVFARRCSFEAAAWAADKAERLNREFGFSWEEIEQIEIETLKTCG